jgi:hypothetical protein
MTYIIDHTGVIQAKRLEDPTIEKLVRDAEKTAKGATSLAPPPVGVSGKRGCE